MVSAKQGFNEELFNEEGDWIAQQFFSEKDLQMSPEEYAARHAHLISSFALHRYRYRDPKLGVWVRRLSEVLSSEKELDRCRRQYLVQEEIPGIREEDKGP